MKDIMKFLFNLYKTPALIIHELSHLLMILFTWTKLDEITVHMHNWKQFNYSVEIVQVSRNWKINKHICLAPIYGYTLVMFSVTLFLDINSFLIVMIYLLSTFKILLPSKEDIDSINNYKSEKELVLEQLKELYGDELNLEDIEL